MWSRAVQELGLGGKCKVKGKRSSSLRGSTSSQALRMALGLILSGQAEIVLVAHAENLEVFRLKK
jgi:acetyl-CoA acetyltransferase